MSVILNSNVTIMVSNMDVAVKFYTESLGFLLKNRYGNHWADIEAPGLAIGLHPAGEDVIKGDNLSIGLNVKNMEEAIAELEPKGIQFKLHDDEQVLLALFTDPDGNELYLVQTKW